MAGIIHTCRYVLDCFMDTSMWYYIILHKTVIFIHLSGKLQFQVGYTGNARVYVFNPLLQVTIR